MSAVLDLSKPHQSRNSVFTVKPEDIVAAPYPHAITSQLVRPDLFSRLKAEFPANEVFEQHQKKIGSRTGRDFFKGDPHFDAFIKRSPAWQEFYDYTCSQAFVDYTMSLFGPHLKNFNCSVDARKTKFVDYTENRFSLWWRSKKAMYLGSRAGDPNEMFTRFDVEQSTTGYDKPVHCDWPSRFISVILYFNDADEIGMEGGDLRIHAPKDKRPYAECPRKIREEETDVLQTLRPRENLGVVFLCSNNSYHSVTGVKAVNGYRKYLYVNVSSMSENIW